VCSVILCALCVLSSTACGQKGPPLAPIVFLPRAVTDVAAKRVEDEVVVQFTVPTLNTDGSSPADLRRIEVYGHTGPLPTPADFLKYGTLVASIDIEEPPQPKEESKEPVAPQEGAGGVVNAPDAGTAQPEAKQEAESAAKAGPKLPTQGMLISVREALTDKQKELGPVPPSRPAPPPLPDAPVVEKLETPGTVNFELPPVRFYTIVPVSDSRGRRGPTVGPIRVPLVEPLLPPETVDVTYTETTISLTWPRQPEDFAPAVTAQPPAAAASPSPAAPTPPSTPPAAAAPTPTPEAPTPETPASPAPALPAPAEPTPPVPAPEARPPVPAAVVSVVEAPALQETPGTVELYVDIETEATRDVAPPAPAATAGAKPSAAAAAAAAAAKAAAAPTPRYGYNVYEAPAVNAPGAPDAPVAPGEARPPVLPLNKAMLTATTFGDPRVEFDVERCYLIRRVEISSGIAIEGIASAPACVTPRDEFAPAAPKNVQAISSGAGVSLLWEANTESDFGGYLVLRGEAPDDKLSPLTPTPIPDTSFSDTTVRRGRTYVYEVVAVDKQSPANQSAPSNRVEETIR
jgi:hypothetical protein